MLAGSGSHKRGIFTEPAEAAKRQAVANPNYQAAFNAFDADRSGFIDLSELSNALQAVKHDTEVGTQRTLFTEPFQWKTVLWLASRFGSANIGMNFPQFAEMMQYLQCLQTIFHEIDTDRTGDLSVTELSRAFAMSGFSVLGAGDGTDLRSIQVMEEIGRGYDADGNGVLTFDEFVQLRLEWDSYLNAWEANVTPGCSTISPQQVLQVLEAVKRSLDPLSAMALSPAVSGIAGFNANFLGSLFHNDMFKVQRPFSLRSGEMLIIRFGAGNLYITFEQFCVMMEFLKKQKTVFMGIDLDRSGQIDLSELATAFAKSGMPMPVEQVMMIGRRFDQDNSGFIEFDEYLQMMIEWTQVGSFQTQFATFGGQRATTMDLQRIFGDINIFYMTVNGVVPRPRAFSIQTCRTLLAMFGSCLPGEYIPSSATYQEFLMLSHHVKTVAAHFAMSDLDNDGSISAGELFVALGRSGLSVSPQQLQTMFSSYDYDRSGRIEFDEYLQMVTEAMLYSNKISSMGDWTSGVVTLDKASLMQLLYAVPRKYIGL